MRVKNGGIDRQTIRCSTCPAAYTAKHQSTPVSRTARLMGWTRNKAHGWRCKACSSSAARRAAR